MPARVVRYGERPFVGRDGEATRLRLAAESVARQGRPGLALISGDVGAGKTALAEALTQRLAACGWTTAWGRSPEYPGAPVAWPWAQITDALRVGRRAAIRTCRVGVRTSPAVPGIPRAGGRGHPAAVRRCGSGHTRRQGRRRSRRGPVPPAPRRRLAGHGGGGRGPVLLVVDDLHRADEDTLDLLTALLAEPEPVTGPVLIVGTFRATEITPELTAALARFARTEPVRIYLGGLSETATGDLARAVARQDLDAPTVRLIHRRSGGNAFFVRELARLLAAEGEAALKTVPAGVRDVIRHRLTRLPDPAQTVLRQAAVIGRDIDPDVLTALAGDEVPGARRPGPRAGGWLPDRTGPRRAAAVHPHPEAALKTVPRGRAGTSSATG
ncbi:AAA family ATPase [Micromonospora sp. ATA32]|nr:AAA family ATPase [Micromonospora sp. ATA32]